MVSRRTERQTPRPFLELHWGALHVVVERVPYQLLAVISGALSALVGALWFGGR
jgi:hypothetical protein